MLSGIATLCCNDVRLCSRVGRKKAMIMFLVVKITGCLVSLLANSYATFGVGRLLVGLGGAGTYLCTYVLGIYTNLTPW